MIRVVKIGGRAQSDPSLTTVLGEISRLPAARLVVIHGGGDEVTALQRRLGQEPEFIGGRRYTTSDDMDAVRMVLSGTVNKRLVGQLAAAGIAAVGVSGEDGGLLPAGVFRDGALGRVGVPFRAERRLLDALLDRGFVPVISPVGYHASTGEGLNVNGDDAAAAIAASLAADELFFLADVAGVLDSSGHVFGTLDLDALPVLLGSGVARNGMAAKLEAGRRAILDGVRVVRVGDLRALRDPALGTSILPSPSAV